MKSLLLALLMLLPVAAYADNRWRGPVVYTDLNCAVRKCENGYKIIVQKDWAGLSSYFFKLKLQSPFKYQNEQWLTVRLAGVSLSSGERFVNEQYCARYYNGYIYISLSEIITEDQQRCDKEYKVTVYESDSRSGRSVTFNLKLSRLNLSKIPGNSTNMEFW